MKVKTIGIDLAKDFLGLRYWRTQRALVHQVTQTRKILSYFANITPCLIGIETCASARFWAGKLMSMDHNAKLMASKFVKPYVKTNKHDAADTEVICEVVSVTDRSRNQIRGLLAGFGILCSGGPAVT